MHICQVRQWRRLRPATLSIPLSAPVRMGYDEPMVAFLQIFIPAVFFVIGLWLLWLLWWVPRQKQREWTGELVPKNGPKIRRCPICDVIMENGDRVKSQVFPGKPDKMTHIFGCPACYPPNAIHKRICPVCKKEVPREGYVIARMFVSPGRKHVHVLGCTGCRDRGLRN